MAVAVGTDIAKQVHWVCLKVAETGQVLASHKVDHTPAEVADLIDEIAAAAAEHGAATVGIDILGGIAARTELAAAAGLALVLKQSGKSRFLQRATAGDNALKRIFYQSAFVAISCDPASKIY